MTPNDPPRSEAASAPPAAPPPGGFLGRWFEPVRIPRDARETLAALATRGSLVFVMRSPGLLNFLYLRWFLARMGLPPLKAAQNFPGLFGWICRVRRSRRALQETVAGGGCSLVFLGAQRPRRDPFATLVRQQRNLLQPVLLVPVLLVWSRRAQKLEGSLWDVLYGSPEAPSALANAIAFLRNFRRAVFEVGRALDLEAFLVDRPAEADALVARKVRGALHQHLAREFRTAVGPPLKAPSRVRERVLRDRTLRATIEAVAAETGKSPSAVAAEASRDLKEIASLYDPIFVRLMSLVLTWVFKRLFTSVEVDEPGLERLRRAAAGAPLVLLPSHKSYVDFLVLPWLLYERGMTPPHVAAGINLSFWPFGRIARWGGAFFIRRKVKGDRVYTAVLRAYVKHLLRDRFPQEFYPEGGRSRNGKLLFPKTGLISMEVDAWLDGAADDVLFVPIAIDYERLIEAGSYAKELEGGEKRKENLRGLLGVFTVLFRRYERLYVQFEEPISLRGLAEARLGARASTLSPDEAWEGESTRSSTAIVLPGQAASDSAKRRLVQALANRVAYGISRAVTITPVGLVACALLSHVRRGISAGEVARRVELLRAMAVADGARLARDLAGAPADPTQAGPIADAVRRLIRERHVHVQTAANEIIYQVVDERRALLDYHRNAVLHRYVAPSLVAAAARATAGGASGEAVRDRALWLSRLFKLEFMYRVGATQDEIFAHTAANLMTLGAVVRVEEELRPGPEAETLAFLAELTRPYLEAYRVAAGTALAVARRAPVDRKALLREALERGRASFLSGEIALRESLSKATLGNAFEWMVNQGLLQELEGGKLRLADRSGAGVLEVVEGIARFLAP